MEKKEKQEINLKKLCKTLKKLIAEQKVKFGFNNDKLTNLDMIQLDYNKKEDRLELEFKEVMEEQMQELNKLVKDNFK